jgi:hypothetical protein
VVQPDLPHHELQRRAIGAVRLRHEHVDADFHHARLRPHPAGVFALHLGMAIGIGGGMGAMLGGAITSRASARDARAFLTLPALTMVIFAVVMALAVWTVSLPIVYAAIWIAAFCQFFLMGPYFGVVQRLAPLRGRAVATAFFFFILATIGLGIGPLYVGTDERFLVTAQRTATLKGCGWR